MAAEPFELGHGVSVRKTCSVGWASYPWCRGAYEALCAEESIALADSALYQAKALGRNQGVGIVPTEAAAQHPEAIELASVRDGEAPWARVIRIACPERPVLEAHAETVAKVAADHLEG
jgi:DNA-binding transcriptional LysR family regulator